MTSKQIIRRRAVLVAPGSDERKVDKALASAADEVVLDLEDAVAPAQKDAAREIVMRRVRELGDNRTVSVRINGCGTAWFNDDLAMCAALGGGLASVVVPKVESAADLLDVGQALGDSPSVTVQPLIETPAGVQNVEEIVTNPRVAGVIIGYADLGAALGRTRTAAPEHWIFVQDRVLHAARAAGVQAIDGPSLGTSDDAAFRHSAAWAADLGFDGKWVIHPSQIDSALAVFSPTEEQVEEARGVLAALRQAEERGAGATRFRGEMLDEAVAVAARRTLSKIGE